MSAFHEAIKQILADVDRFLKSSLKDESLSKPVQKEKNKILESLQKLYDEYEVLNPNQEDGSSNSSKGLTDDSRFTTGSTHSHGSHGSEEDGGYSDNIPETTVKALTKATKLGYLTKKPTELLEMFSKGKKYCVIHKNILYWFKKPSDKKQQGAVILTGYEFKDVSLAKEIIFELSSTKKKCVQFQADTREDLEEWKIAVETALKYVEPPKPAAKEKEEFDDIEDFSGEEYEPIDEVVAKVKNYSVQIPISSDKLPPPAMKSASQPPPSSPQDIYDEGISMPKSSQPRPPPPPPDDDDELIYEEFESSPGPDEQRSAVPATQAPRPPLPAPNQSSSRPPLPPPNQPQASQVPPPLPSRGANIPSPKKISPDLNKVSSLLEDYENLFYGVWACKGQSDNELTFDRGDIVHVLNRDLDGESWWVGETGGTIGLVPKAYLAPAYKVVAAA